MNILIAGGSGLIGSHLAARLVQKGNRVWVLTRNPHEVQVPDGVNTAAWEPRAGGDWQNLIEQADAIVNLAGVSLGGGLWTARRKKKILESRLNSGRALVEAIRNATHKPAVFLQSSAIGYYGYADDSDKTEDAQPGGDFLAQVCVEWENSSRDVETMGVRRVVARSALVLSARGGVMDQVSLPFKLFAGGPLGSGRQWWSWIHIADEVEAMLWLLENDTCQGPYNLSAPQALRMRDFGKTLAPVLRRPYWLPVPAFALRLILGQMSILVLEGQKVIPQKLLEAGYSFRYPDLRPALQDLFSG